MSCNVALRIFGTSSSLDEGIGEDVASRRRKSVGKEEHRHGDIVVLVG